MKKETVVVKKEGVVLKPVLEEATKTISISDGQLAKGECLVCQIDTSGNEIEGSLFSTSTRMWDRVYSKQSIFKLKKK